MATVNKGEKYIIDIESVSSDGNGVGHIGGMAVFVPHSCGGDCAEIKITEVKRRFAYGEVIRITEPSPDRIEPNCPLTQVCGGCQLRHMKYGAEILEKAHMCENALRRIGGFNEFAVDEIIAAGQDERYRNKAVFQISKGRSGAKAGFYMRKSRSVIEVCDCRLCNTDFPRIAGAVAKYIDLSNADSIKSVFVRESRKTGEIMAVINAGLDTLPKEELLIDMILKASDKVSGILIESKNRTRTLFGSDRINEEICGVTFCVSHKSFLQVNPLQTERLYKKALEFADIKKSDTVTDIYCGIGTITLAAARSAKYAVGIEKVTQAVCDAKMNAELNGIENVSFFDGSAENIMPALTERGERSDVVILDPPRSGSDEKTLGAILKAQPLRIVYVSCNSATLARDLRFLCGGGYEISRSAACDMFPRTMHMEMVVKLEKTVD